MEDILKKAEKNLFVESNTQKINTKIIVEGPDFNKGYKYQ